MKSGHFPKRKPCPYCRNTTWRTGAIVVINADGVKFAKNVQLCRRCNNEVHVPEVSAEKAKVPT
jgi:RNA polymerase subunit RPABC4/transcription elongation factor Spt4